MLIFPPAKEPTKIIAPFICEWENIWQNTDVIIDEIEKITNDPLSGVKFDLATVLRPNDSKKELSNYRTNSNLSLTDAGYKNTFFRELNNLYFFTVNEATEWYRQNYGINEPMYHVEGYNLLRYQTGEEYKAHYDGGTSLHRGLSPILYLNNDYEGGEIEFVHHNIKIKPKSGSLYLFPPFYTHSHIAHPVKKGTKYAIVTWLHDTERQ